MRSSNSLPATPKEGPLLAWPGVTRATLESAIESAGMVALTVPIDVPPDGSYRKALVRQIVEITKALYPAWLPGAEDIRHGGGSALSAVGILARRLAATSDAYGPYVESLALAVLGDAPSRTGFPLEVEADGCHTLIARAYGVGRVVLVLDVAAGLDTWTRAVVQDAAQWLAGRDAFLVWLAGDDLAGFDRVPIARQADSLAEPTEAAEWRREPSITPLSGHPSATSETEQRMERFLARQDWAFGRAWNKDWNDGALASRIRVDLMWEAERIVVELDGPDHTDRRKYRDDRARDRSLMRSGFRVLRYTNDEIADDITRVGDEIADFLAQSRVVARAETADGLRHT